MQASLAQHNRSAGIRTHRHAQTCPRAQTRWQRAKGMWNGAPDRVYRTYVLAQLKTQHNGKYGSCPSLTPTYPPPSSCPVRHFASLLLLPPETEARSYNTHIYSNYKERIAASPLALHVRSSISLSCSFPLTLRRFLFPSPCLALARLDL